MGEVKNKQVVLKEHIKSGYPEVSDFGLKTDEHMKLKVEEGSNEILVKNLYLSVDPYMRSRMTKTQGSYVDAFTPGQVFF